MKSISKLVITILGTVGIVCWCCFSVLAENVRQPIRAGSFYPSDPSELKHVIAELTHKAQKTQVQLPRNKYLRAIIMPHAGYIYSGWTAAHASLVLEPNQFSKIVLLGPDHFIGFRNGAVTDATAYQTPLGQINLHDDAKRAHLHSNLFQSIPISSDREHSLEVVLPFLQSYLGKFQLVPIIVGQADAKSLSEVLDSIMDRNTVLIVSSDLSHYLPYSDAVIRDRETIRMIMELNPGQLIKSDNRACGASPISILLHMARRHQWQPVLLHYSNSGDTAGDRSRVVGYAAVAFFGDSLMQEKPDSRFRFSQKQGQTLIELARQTISKKLEQDVLKTTSQSLTQALQDNSFQSHCGTFVTLKIQGQLRGCIGNLTSTESIIDGVKRNAINAAFHDPRFAPLSNHELEQTKIEVSVLTEPEPLTFQDGEDLLKKLRVNVDGVIIRKGRASATFLPQVWEQLPRPEDFLSHLCLKAGLSSDAWKSSELDVMTYQVQYFEEQ
jgi:AmmeMemoRadiSam system protein B/AmmeMemoRadiSam system protein A